jgi:hypothetical protein
VEVRGPHGARADGDADRVLADGDRFADDLALRGLDPGDRAVARVRDLDEALADGQLARVPADRYGLGKPFSVTNHSPLVIHVATSTLNSAPPTGGSAIPGSARERTITTLTAKAP